jgi:phage FluMu protein Com
MIVYSCKKCGELNYLTPHAFWDITDFGAKCEKCEMINTITLEKGEPKTQIQSKSIYLVICNLGH